MFTLAYILLITSLFIDSTQRTKRGKATIQTSLSFFDAMMFFNIMVTTAAGFHQLSAKTIYEIDMAMFVIILSHSTCLTLSFVRHLPQSHEKRKVRVGCQILSLSISSFAMCGTLFMMSLGNYDSKEDYACYGRSTLPQMLVIISACTEIIITIALSSFSINDSGIIPESVRNSQIPRHRHSCYYPLFSILHLAHIATAICTFIFMILIRNKAKKAFGESFDDNVFGYRQIIACGFCL